MTHIVLTLDHSEPVFNAGDKFIGPYYEIQVWPTDELPPQEEGQDPIKLREIYLSNQAVLESVGTAEQILAKALTDARIEIVNGLTGHPQVPAGYTFA